MLFLSLLLLWFFFLFSLLSLLLLLSFVAVVVVVVVVVTVVVFVVVAVVVVDVAVVVVVCCCCFFCCCCYCCCCFLFRCRRCLRGILLLDDCADFQTFFWHPPCSVFSCSPTSVLVRLDVGARRCRSLGVVGLLGSRADVQITVR